MFPEDERGQSADVAGSKTTPRRLLHKSPAICPNPLSMSIETANLFDVVQTLAPSRPRETRRLQQDLCENRRRFQREFGICEGSRNNERGEEKWVGSGAIDGMSAGVEMKGQEEEETCKKRKGDGAVIDTESQEENVVTRSGSANILVERQKLS